MSTTVKPTILKPDVAPSTKPLVSSATKINSTSQSNVPQDFLFDKQNYMLIIAGIVLILLGFMLMAGGKSANPHEFHYDEIYSFRRITLAPIVLIAGIVLEIYAIMKKPNN